MIVPFGERHRAQAAVLVARVCRRQRGVTPQVPDLLSAPERVESLLGSSGVAGVAMVRGSEVAGFLAGWHVPLFGGLPGVFVPEWGHGAPDPGCYRDLYAAAAAEWVGDGRTVHALSLFAADREAEDVWHDLGFGRVVVDRVRDLSPAGGGGISVRAAVPGDGPAIADLRRCMSQYLAAPPVCRSGDFPESGAAIDDALAGHTGYAAFLASDSGEIVGFVDTAPDADDAPRSLSGREVVRVGGAFTVPERRRAGVGAGLLDALFSWARGKGYRACSLDHESANVAGARFWQALGFAPALHSVVRRV